MARWSRRAIAQQAQRSAVNNRRVLIALIVLLGLLGLLRIPIRQNRLARAHRRCRLGSRWRLARGLRGAHPPAGDRRTRAGSDLRGRQGAHLGVREKRHTELRAHVRGRELRCEPKGHDRFERVLAICFLPDGSDLNAWIVRHGWALASDCARLTNRRRKRRRPQDVASGPAPSLRRANGVNPVIVCGARLPATAVATQREANRSAHSLTVV